MIRKDFPGTGSFSFRVNFNGANANVRRRATVPVHQFAIAPASRELLHQRIELRFHQMLASGFEAEVRALFARGDLHTDLPSIRCVGYRQMWSYIEGEISYDEMVYRGVCATRQLAKRQMTRCAVGKGCAGLTVRIPIGREKKYYRLLVLSQTECVQLRRIVRNFSESKGSKYK